MKRREFMALLGGAAAWPFAAGAQQPSKLPIVGFLGVDPAAWKAWTTAFVERLRELGWIDGRTVVIEFRWSEGRSDGMSLVAPEIAGKRLELLRECVPNLRRLAIMADVGFPQAVLEMVEVEAMARTLGIEVIKLEIRRAEDIAAAMAALKSQADALYVVIKELLNASRVRIVSLAQDRRLPSIFGTRDWAQSGGLMSYGPNFPSLFRRAAELTDRILRGTKPGDIPVEQPTKIEVVINLGTAKALGLTVPPSLLARVDEVIE